MEFEMNLEKQMRNSHLRKSAKKLATVHSRHRVVRKLPKAYGVVKTAENPVKAVRFVLNQHKVGGYACLVGMCLAAFIQELDQDVVYGLRDVVNSLASIAPILG